MPITPETMSSARVLVVGDVMLDRYWYGAVDRISPEAPVPVVRVTRTEERIGAAANVAYNIVTLGAHASLLTVVGDDEASHQLEALVAKTGISTYFGRDARLKTTVKLRVIGRQQQLIRLDFENTPESEVLASQTAAFEKLYPEHEAVLFSDYGKGGLAHIPLMIAKARAAGKAVLVDPKGDDTGGPPAAMTNAGTTPTIVVPAYVGSFARSSKMISGFEPTVASWIGIEPPASSWNAFRS